MTGSPIGIWATCFLAMVACGRGGTEPGATRDARALIGVPSAAPLVAAGCSTVTVTIPSPGFTDGDAPASFRIERSLDGGGVWATVAEIPADPPGGSVTLTDQPAREILFRYFTRSATEEAGPSPMSAVVPFAAPDPPTAVAALPGSSRATVTWQLPADSHGSAFTQDVIADAVSCDARRHFAVAADATRAVAGDEAQPLSSAEGAWSFRVAATNRCGTSTSAPSAPILLPPWNPTPVDQPLPLGAGIFGMGAAQVDGAQYLIGGLDPQLEPHDGTLRTRQDPSTPVDGRLLPWQQSGALHQARAFPAVAANRALDGTDHLYAMGGRGAGLQAIAAVEDGRIRGDGSAEWSTSPSPLPAPRALAAGFVNRQFLYVVGGLTADAGGAEALSSDVLVTSIAQDGSLAQDTSCDTPMPAWQVAGTTPPGDNSLHRAGAAVVTALDFLFVIGGIGYDATRQGVVELDSVYRIKLRPDGRLDCDGGCHWVAMPPLTDASGAPLRLEGGSAFIGNSSVYYVGGFGSKSGVVLRARLEPDDNGDPMFGPWTEAASFNQDGMPARDGPAAFGIGPFLYVAGGFGVDSPQIAFGDSLFAHTSRDGSIGP